jgi:ribonuclease HII
MPDFRLEAEAGGMIAGVDEAGRGPWAGPVVAAAVVLDADNLPPALADAIDDSKKLTPTARNAVAAGLVEVARIGIGAASVAEIGTRNILGATLFAMGRAVAALEVVPDLVLVDGNRLPDLPCPARAVVKGDSLSLSIAAASIMAKVTRDRIMTLLARHYPGFGWERNAGYGTPEHRAGLGEHGITPHHRLTFAPIRRLLEPQDIESGLNRDSKYSK